MPDRKTIMAEIDSKFVIELTAMKNIYTKLLTFLEDKDACTKAGYFFYKKYSWHYDGTSAIAYILAYDNPKEEYFRLDFCRDTRYNDLYSIQANLRGSSFVKFVVNFLRKHHSEVSKDTSQFSAYLKNIMDAPCNADVKDCYLIHSQIFTNKNVAVKPLKPLKVLADMKLRLNFANIFPLVHIPNDNRYIAKHFNMNNLDLSNKMIDAIMAGINNYD